VSDVDRLDAAPILHEEVGRLPEEFRAPLVLCYFERLTHDQAASQLGWPVGTVRSRLAKARDRLRPRLLRRGVGPSIAILAATGRGEATATVPAALVSATIQMALGAGAAGAGAAGAVPAAVAALVGKVLREMTLMKISMIATGLVATVLVGITGQVYVAVAARPQDAEKAVAPKQNDPVPRVDAAGSVPTAIERGRDRSTPPASNLRPGVTSARVLWAKLNAATQSLQLARAAHAAARGKYDQVVAAQGEIEALAAELNTCADDLGDEVDLLQAQLEIRKADVQAAEAQAAKAILSHKYAEKLAKSSAVSQNEVLHHQKEVDIRSAELAKKQAERNEVVLRIKQATRRRDEAIALARRANGLVPEHEAPPGPADPAAKR
jgi:Sigma-70, region 4